MCAEAELRCSLRLGFSMEDGVEQREGGGGTEKKIYRRESSGEEEERPDSTRVKLGWLERR